MEVFLRESYTQIRFGHSLERAVVKGSCPSPPSTTILLCVYAVLVQTHPLGSLLEGPMAWSFLVLVPRPPYQRSLKKLFFTLTQYFPTHSPTSLTPAAPRSIKQQDSIIWGSVYNKTVTPFPLHVHLFSYMWPGAFLWGKMETGSWHLFLFNFMLILLQ